MQKVWVLFMGEVSGVHIQSVVSSSGLRSCVDENFSNSKDIPRFVTQTNAFAGFDAWQPRL